MSGGQLAAALAEFGVVALGHVLNERVGAGNPGCGFDIGPLYARRAEADVPGDGIREQSVLLQRDRHVGADVVDGHGAQVDAVDLDGSGIGFVEPQQERHQRGLAGAGRADDRGDSAGVGVQINAM